MENLKILKHSKEFSSKIANFSVYYLNKIRIKQYKKMDYYDFVFPGWDYEQEKWLRKEYMIKPYEIIYTDHCEVQDDDFLNRSYCYEFESQLNFIKYKEWGEEKDLYHKEHTKGFMVFCYKDELLRYLKRNKLTIFECL